MPLRARGIAIVWPALVAAGFFGLLHAGSPRPAAASASVGAPSTPTPLRQVRTRWFVLWTDAPLDRAAELADTLDLAAERFLKRSDAFGLPVAAPTQPLVCVFFSRHTDFLRFASAQDGVDASWMGGYYAAGANRVVAYDDASGAEFSAALAACPAETPEGRARREALLTEAWDATREKLLHEAAHLLAFNTGLQTPSVAYPAWLTEGIAESFARGSLGGSPARPGAAHSHVACAASPVSRPEYPDPKSRPDEIDSFYAGSLSLVDSMLTADPGALAALLRDVRSSPSEAHAARLARDVAARFTTARLASGDDAR